MPIQKGGLQVQEEEEQSRFLSVPWGHLSSRSQLGVDRAPCGPAYKAGRGARKGERREWTLPLQCDCPKLGFHTCCQDSFELFGSVFFFPTLRKWLQIYWSGKVILFSFFILPTPFPFNQKEIPSWDPSPPFMQNWKWQHLLIAITV